MSVQQAITEVDGNSVPQIPKAGVSGQQAITEVDGNSVPQIPKAGGRNIARCLMRRGENRFVRSNNQVGENSVIRSLMQPSLMWKHNSSNP